MIRTYTDVTRETVRKIEDFIASDENVINTENVEEVGLEGIYEEETLADS